MIAASSIARPRSLPMGKRWWRGKKRPNRIVLDDDDVFGFCAVHQQQQRYLQHSTRNRLSRTHSNPARLQLVVCQKLPTGKDVRSSSSACSKPPKKVLPQSKESVREENFIDWQSPPQQESHQNGSQLLPTVRLREKWVVLSVIAATKLTIRIIKSSG